MKLKTVGPYKAGYTGRIYDINGRAWYGTVEKVFLTTNFGWALLKEPCPLNHARIIKLG